MGKLPVDFILYQKGYLFFLLLYYSKALPKRTAKASEHRRDGVSVKYPLRLVCEALTMVSTSGTRCLKVA